MRIDLKFDQAEYPDKKLNDSITEILNDNYLMAVSTINKNESYINTAYYCFNEKMDLFMLTEPFKQHSKNVESNKSVALAIYDSHQPWDEHKRGLQVIGDCEIAVNLFVFTTS